MSDGSHFLRDVHEEILEVQNQLERTKELVERGKTCHDQPRFNGTHRG